MPVHVWAVHAEPSGPIRGSIIFHNRFPSARPPDEANGATIDGSVTVFAKLCEVSLHNRRPVRLSTTLYLWTRSILSANNTDLSSDDNLHTSEAIQPAFDSRRCGDSEARIEVTC